MSNLNTFRNLLFRLHLNPAPRTQSESKAVLRALQDFGPVSLFQIIRNNHEDDVIETPTDGEVPLNSAVANLAFARNTRALSNLRKGLSKRRFTVTANANIPDASIRDPFNVRGLQSQKSELEPREIECRITVPTLKEYNRVTSKDNTTYFRLVRSNRGLERDCHYDYEYSDSFAIDRNSVLGEVLAKTDCPSGLISGLMPKLKNEHRTLAFQQLNVIRGDVSNHSEHKGGRRLIQYEHDLHSTGDGNTILVSLNLDAFTNESSSASVSTTKAVSKTQQPLHSTFLNQHTTAANTTRYHDEFATLRNVSLMQMYRKAVKPVDDIVNGDDKGENSGHRM